jgi:ribosome-binding factor A
LKNPDRGALHAGRVRLALVQELAELFRDEIGDPALDDVRVLDVDLSPDGRYARVHLSLPTSRDATAATRALARAAAFLRARIAQDLSLERTPELRFALHQGEIE